MRGNIILQLNMQSFGLTNAVSDLKIQDTESYQQTTSKRESNRNGIVTIYDDK